MLSIGGEGLPRELKIEAKDRGESRVVTERGCESDSESRPYQLGGHCFFTVLATGKGLS